MHDRAGCHQIRPSHVVRHGGWYLAVVLLSMTLAFPTVLLAQVSTPTAASTPVIDTSDPRLATIKPDLREQVAARIGDTLSTYTIATTLVVGAHPGLNGKMPLDYVNMTGEALEALPFRLYANGADEEVDSIIVDDVTIDGASVDPVLTVANSVMTVPLAAPLPPQGRITIELAFEATLPVDTSDHYGIFGIDTKTGSWALAHWYPIVAGWDPANGWELDPTSVNGDPIFSNTALYDVTITSPATWALVTTGSMVEDQVDGTKRTRHFLSGPVRDFTIVADSDFQSLSTEVDGTTVTSWFNPGTERVGKAVLTYAAQSLALYNTLIGPYPYLEFDIVPVELYGAAGVEFPQLIYIGQSYYANNIVPDEPSYLNFTVSHEVMHQWWYGLVGNNQYVHAFTDEGLTNFISSKVYFSKISSEAFADIIFMGAVQSPFQTTVARGDDQIVDQPTDDFPSEGAYVFAVYSKAPMGFNAIYDEIGEEAFFAGLSAYYQEFMFGIAQPDDLRDAFAQASGKDLTALWDHWFHQAAGADDI
ncbi:MAG: M1 family metallopeptidase [Thermomicrobiales bacterium]